ncbi:DNA-3-methyladenine glycosylase family protein [Lacticaseibacillus thailandensis]|uniref:DNA-3-methyladenine glycosylase II n=1 Tax=Lacticaseibacillus thailandensis DSM 22698 = JCM 13996 TaxID=1423810 RepID=A0A0R2C5G2_9LACO|nr:DNA-3-methyladenine glycosylase [Lacticaseibacillus thailandensis]KRM86973.1 hypothetical protein FD19_GL001554 [Lacticaseibacillus thailandensis DSM 22698 = JCM 13996]
MPAVHTLTADTPAVRYLCAKDKHLAKVIQMVGSISYTLAPSPYAFMVREIINQMLSNKVAAVFSRRLAALVAGPVTPGAIHQLTDAQLLSIGISRAKVRYIRALTDAVVNHTIDFDQYPDMSDTEVLHDLTSVRGIGNWSAKMYLIFVLDRPDVLPFEDVAFLQGYSWVYKTNDWHRQAVMKKCRKWHPYRAIAARYMYRAVDMELTKKPFHLFK